MAHLFQVGAGSGGMVVLDLVARDPRVSRVTLVEPDVYAPHNVHRHLFPSRDVGRLKADAARDWLADRRPDLAVTTLPVDLTDPAHQATIDAAVADCDLGVCAADNEAAKYHFDRLMRSHSKPWTLGEVLSGGIGGWVHRFTPGGPCYGCVASYLQREPTHVDPAAPPPAYAANNGPAQTTIPATRAGIASIASLHAVLTLGLLPPADDPGFTSLLVELVRVPGVFDQPFRPHPFRIPRADGCLICSPPTVPAGEDLDAALDQALARLGDE